MGPKCSFGSFLILVLVWTFSCEVVHVVVSSNLPGIGGIYDVVITRNQVIPAKELANELMFTKKGQPFRCSIPEVPPDPDSSHLLESLSTEAIKTALQPNALQRFNGDCIQLLSNAWWQYEYCFSRRINQFHLTEKNKKEPLISLGIYSHDFDWSSVDKKEALKKKDRYHLQYFVNGSVCGETGKPREATVKIVCNQEGPNRPPVEDYIESVAEPSSCIYEIIIQSKRLCKIDYFDMKPATANQIICNPATDVPALKIYHKELEREKEQLEKAKLLAKKNKKAKKTSLEETLTDEKKELNPKLAQQQQRLKQLVKAHQERKSPARTFQDVINEMNPFVKQMRKLENMLRQRINAVTGQDIEIKLLDTGDVPAAGEVQAGEIDQKQMEIIQEYLANMFTTQFGQQKHILDLENAYEDKTVDESKTAGSFKETQMMDIVLTKEVEEDSQEEEEEEWYDEQQVDSEDFEENRENNDEDQENEIEIGDDLPPLV